MKKIRHPDAISSLALVGVALVLFLVMFAVSTVLMEQERLARRETIQREVNGNQAMIYAVCRALKRRDKFEADRLTKAQQIEFQHESMTKPFSPVVKDYFKARRKAIATAALEQKQKFVNFDCIKGMERAYADGYGSNAAPNGRPPTPPARHAVSPPSPPASLAH